MSFEAISDNVKDEGFSIEEYKNMIGQFGREIETQKLRRYSLVEGYIVESPAQVTDNNYGDLSLSPLMRRKSLTESHKKLKKRVELLIKSKSDSCKLDFEALLLPETIGLSGAQNVFKKKLLEKIRK
jgi:hypothetical protein